MATGGVLWRVMIISHGQRFIVIKSGQTVGTRVEIALAG